MLRCEPGYLAFIIPMQKLCYSAQRSWLTTPPLRPQLRFLGLG